MRTLVGKLHAVKGFSMTSALFQEPASAPVDVPPEEDPDAPSAEAPYGWTRDPVTGERRPKKTAGRRRKDAPAEPAPSTGTPSLEELKARAKDSGPKAEDVAPSHQHQHRPVFFGLKQPKATAAKAPEPAPPFRAGPIAKGMNKLYRRAGKIVKMWDPEVGDGIIRCTRKDEDDEDEITVGEAWEELARTNPRIRAFLTKLITGGAWSSLFAAHLPILIAILLKDGIRSRLPFVRLVDAFLVDEDDQGQEMPSDMAQMMGGVGPVDMAQMMEFAQSMMGRMADGMPRGMNDVRDVQEAG